MANTRLIRRRIRGVGSIAKITRAMEMIATLKMRRAQERGLAGRPYAEKIQQVLADLAAISGEGEASHPLLQRRPVKKIALVHITPDRGLSGGLVSGINRKAGGFILEQKVPVNVVAVGRKGIEFMRRYRRDIRAEFSALGDHPGLLDILPIARVVIDDYSHGLVDQVFLVYARFISTIIQKPVVQEILPVAPAAIPAGQNVDYIYEPDPEHVLGELLPRLAPLMTTLEAGELLVRKAGEEIFVAVSGGFIEVRPDRIIVLADAAERADEIDIARAEAAKKRAEAGLKGSRAPTDSAMMEAALRRSLPRLKVAEKRKRRHIASQNKEGNPTVALYGLMRIIQAFS